MALLLIACNKGEHKLYDGKDLSENFTVLRDKTSKEASLKTAIEGKWKVYSGKSVETIDTDKPILEGEGSGTFKLPVDPSSRNYFQIVTNDGKVTIAERHLPMEGGYNFRDIGGYKTTDGRFVKWGKIFRSDDLHKLTTKDLHYLSTIPIISIVDFRSGTEMTQAPDLQPESLKNIYDLSISPGNLNSFNFDENFDEGIGISLMKEVNILLVSDSVSISRYKEFFKILQNENNIPLMFHCSAGKDRTGLGTALILFALGVDEETIMEDYLLSNTYLSGKYESLMEQNPIFKDLFSVRKEYLQAGINHIKETYGSVETYLKDVLEVDTEAMKNKYLY